MLDILIKNGLVIDGSGSAGVRADVAIAGGHIAEVGLLPAAEAATIIDATGLVVAPGFIDMHSHADFSLPVCPTADSLVHQGITTAVVGQCGFSPAPLLEETREPVIRMMDTSLGQAGERLPWDRWTGFKTYLEDLSRVGTSLNVVPLVGQGTVRAGVMGFAPGPANPEQRSRMTAAVAKAMDEGAFGGLANTKKPVNTPEDLKGLRIRAMDKSQTQYLEAWGASTVIVPWAEIYNALQTGIADGSLNAAVVPLLFKHTEVLKFYSDLRFAAPLRVGICSEDWYKKLKPDQKKIVDDAAAKATAANRAWQVQIDKTGLEDLEKAGTKITRNTTEQRAQFSKLVRPVYEKIVGREVAEAFVKASDANR